MSEKEEIMVSCSYCGRETESDITHEGPVYCSEACEIDAEARDGWEQDRPSPEEY